jgi:Amt family ammonium transporter
LTVGALLLVAAAPLLAQEAPAEPLTLESLKAEIVANQTANKVMADTLWVMIAGFLVFFMNLGFGCVESGMCRAKNCVNILSKNFVVFAVASLAFWLVGFGLMFGGGSEDTVKYIGSEGVLMVGGADNSPAGGDEYQGAYGSLNWTTVPLWAKFFFQLVFAGTAATIVSGAVAERIKYKSFLIFTFILTAVIYPVVGHWIWGGGLLAVGQFFGEGEGMFDFAGSTVVHSVGGWAALAGIIVLGPRLGKYGPGGKINAIPGHNMTAATIGCFILWLGWFGFNPGSTMMADGSAIARIAVMTNFGAIAGTLAATFTAWILLGKPDLGMTLNGCLAGLVAITAPCAFVTAVPALIIGAVAGVLVVLSVILFDRVKLDDPVGATSVHLVNGIWGTLAVGLFGLKELGLPHDGLLMGGGTAQLIPQALGVVIAGVYVFGASLLGWMILKYTMGIRVPAEEEIQGLDIGEHGNEAYHGFAMITDTVGVGAEPRPAAAPPERVPVGDRVPAGR